MSVLSDKDIFKRWRELFPYTPKSIAWFENKV